MQVIKKGIIENTTTEPVQIIQPVQTNTPAQYTKKKKVFRAFQIVWYIWGVIITLLAFRFCLEFLGANPYSGFATFIYTLSKPFVAPFQGVFGTIMTAKYVLDWGALLAILVYTIIVYLVSYFLQILYPVTPHELDKKTDE
jgi:uncharacterized protein YggT (Ycf19 family)